MGHAAFHIGVKRVHLPHHGHIESRQKQGFHHQIQDVVARIVQDAQLGQVQAHLVNKIDGPQPVVFLVRVDQ